MANVNINDQNDQSIVDQAETEAIEKINKRVALYKKDEKKAERDAVFVKENLFNL